MFVLSTFLTALLITGACATPLPGDFEALRFPSVDPKELLCQLPILKKFICPRSGNSSLYVKTPLGLAIGTPDDSGVRRFVVKYASASRWAPSTVASTWTLPSVFPYPAILRVDHYTGPVPLTRHRCLLPARNPE